MMKLGEPDCFHAVGNQKCDECWPGYPKPCDNLTHAGTGVCPGLIHASFGDEMEDGYWLYTKCDVCGEAE
jgi:hypothetical protein